MVKNIHDSHGTISNSFGLYLYFGVYSKMAEKCIFSIFDDSDLNLSKALQVFPQIANPSSFKLHVSQVASEKCIFSIFVDSYLNFCKARQVRAFSTRAHASFQGSL